MYLLRSYKDSGTHLLLSRDWKQKEQLSLSAHWVDGVIVKESFTEVSWMQVLTNSDEAAKTGCYAESTDNLY